MSVSGRWYTPEKTALLLTFHAPWTWDEYEQTSRAIVAAFTSVPQIVDLVIDVSQAGNLPADALDRLRNSYADPTENLGHYIFVGADEAFKAMFSVADRYYTALGGSLDAWFVDTLDELDDIREPGLQPGR